MEQARPDNVQEAVQDTGSVGSLRDAAFKCCDRESMVGVIGFEPTTPSSRTRCATRLRYTPTCPDVIVAARCPRLIETAARFRKPAPGQAPIRSGPFYTMKGVIRLRKQRSPSTVIASEAWRKPASSRVAGWVAPSLCAAPHER